MSSDLYFNNVKFISAKQAGLISGYSPDYVGQLCRGNKLVCQRVGKSWYVKEESLSSYMAVVAEQLKQTRELQSSALKLVQVHSSAVSPVEKIAEEKKEVSQISSIAPVVATKTTRSYPFAAFYSHYLLALPLLLAKLAESVRTHRSFFYTDLIKKTASLAFVFLFGFGLAGAATINASKIAQVPRKVYSAISDINTYYAAGFAQVYLFLGENLFDGTRSTFASLEKCGSNPALCITGGVRSVASVQSKTVDTSVSATLAFVENAHARTFAYVSNSLAFRDQKVMNVGVSVGRDVSVNALAQVAAAPQTIVDKAGTRVYRTVNTLFVKSGGALLSLFSNKKGVIVINPAEISVSASREAQSTLVKSTVAYNPSVIVKNNTLIERIVEVSAVPLAGTYADIQKQIADLNSSINNRFAGLSTGGASTGNAVTNIYQQIAQSQRIDRLDNVVLSNPIFVGGISLGTTTLTNLVVTNTSTSTFAGGVDLGSGCIAQNGVCITGGGGGSGDVGAGTIGQIPFYAANGTELTATSSLFIASNGYVGIGSTTPFKNFSVTGDAAIDGELRVNSFLSLGSTTLQNATSTSFFASLLQAATAGFDTLSSTFATLTNLNVTNSTTTNATSTNLFSTNFVATNSTTTNSYISSLVALNASTTNASSTNLYATSISSGNITSTNGYVGTLLSNTLTANSINATSSTATSTFTGGLSVVKGLNLGSGYIFGGGLTSCSSSADKLIWDAATGQFGCGADAGAGGGITGLRAQYSSYQTGSSQTFATSSDTNIGLTITSAGDIHTFTPVWSGVLSVLRGGTGISNPTAAGVLLGNYAGTGYMQVATSSLGLSTSNIAEGSNLYYLDSRVQAFINGSTTIPKLYTNNIFAGTNTFNGALVVGALNGPLQANNGVVSATTSIGQLYGGTGITSYSAGDILYANGSGILTKLAVGGDGLVLKINAGLPSWQTDITSGGGGGATAWSTTTNSMIVYPTDTADILVVGSNATTTTGNIFEVAGNSLFGGNVSVGSTSPFAKLSVNATGGAPSFAIGSSTGTSFIVDKNGNVGVGTATPTDKLYVNGDIGIKGTAAFYPTSGAWYGIQSDAGVDGLIMGHLSGATPHVIDQTFLSLLNGGNVGIGGVSASTNPVVKILTSGRVGIGSTTPSALLSVNAPAGSPSFAIGSSTGTSFIVSASGNVGIGTTNTETKLAVNGDISLPRTSNIIFGQNSDGTGEKIGNSSYGLSFYVSNSERLRIGAAKTYIVGNGSSSGLEFRNTATGWTYGGIYTEDITGWNGALVFTTDGDGVNNNNPTEKMRISPDGNVGIATTSPFGSLAVNNIAGQPGFVVGSSTATSFIVDKNGNVGIGKSAPTAALDVVGNIKVSPSLNQNTPSLAALGETTGIVFQGSNNNKIGIAVSGSNNFNFASTYFTGYSTSVIGFSATTAASGWSAAPDTTFSRLSAGVMGVGTGVQGSTAGTLIAGNIGIGTTTPYAKLAIGSHNAGTGPQFVVASSSTGVATSTAFIVDQNGNVGVGTALPTSKLHVVGNLDATGYITNSTGIVVIRGSSAAGDTVIQNLSGTQTIKFNNSGNIIMGTSVNGSGSKLDVQGSASFGSYGAVAAAPSNGIIVSGAVGIGTSTPVFKLNITSTTQPQIALSGADTDSPWTFRSIGGALYIATSSPTTFATSSVAALNINTNGTVFASVGLSTPEITNNGNTKVLINSGYGFNVQYDGSNRIAVDGAGNIALGRLSQLSISDTGFATTTVSGLNISGSATSTSNVGFNITTGCFAVNGSCLTNSTAIGTVNAGTAGQFPYYAGSGTTLTATSSLFIDPSTGVVGVGTVSPAGRFHVRAKSTDNAALVVDSGPDSNPWAIQFARDGLSSAYVYMQDNATLGFQATLNPFTDNDSSQTLGTPSKRWNALNIGTGASSFGGNLSVTGTLGVTGQTTLRQASSTGISAGYAYFGTTATSSFSNTGVLTLASALTALNGGTGLSSVSAAGVLLGNYTGTGYQQIATSSLGLLTTNITEGSNLYYLDSRVQSFIHSSTTIPKTYTVNTFTGANTFNSTVTFGSLNGPLQANNGVVSATTSVGVLYGGTGLTAAPSYGNILVGNSAGGYTLTATSSLGLPTFAFPFTSNTSYNSTSTTIGFTNGLFSTASSTFSGPFRLGALSNGALAVYSGLVGSYATTTAGTGLTYSGNAFNVNTTQSISTLSNLTTNGIVTTSGGTGALSVTTNGTNGTVLAMSGGVPAWVATTTAGTGLSYNGTSFLLNTANANTWSVLQTFNYSSSTAYSSFLNASSTNLFLGTGQGALYVGSNQSVKAVATSTPTFGTGLTYSGTAGQFLGGASGTLSVNTSQNISTLSNLTTNGLVTTSGGTGALSVTANSTNGFVLAMSAGVPTWVATTTLSTISGTLPVSKGGTNATSFAPNSIIVSDSAGTALIATGTQLTVGNLIATTTARSYFLGNVGIGSTSPIEKFVVAGGNAIIEGSNSVSLSLNRLGTNFDNYVYFRTNLSTDASVGLENTTGNFLLSGPSSAITRLSAGNSATLNLSAGASSVITFSVNSVERARFDTNGNFGIGTSSPFAKLSIAGTDTSTTLIGADALSGFTGNLIDLKVASTTKFSVSGSGFATTTVSGLNISGSATSTSNVGFNITTGCFAVNGSCLTNSTAIGTVNAGTAGQFPYYAGSGTTLTATSSLFIDPSTGVVGVGTVSPAGRFHVRAKSTDNAALVVDSGPDSNPWAIQFARDGLSSAYVYMQDNATLGFQATLNPFTDNDSSQTLGTPSKRWNALNIGTGASSFGGNLSVTGTLGVTGQTTLRQASSTLLSANTGYFNNIFATSTTQFSGFGATTTPFAQLSVNSVAGSPSFAIGSSTATSFIVDKNGNVGVGKVAPTVALDVTGAITGSGVVTGSTFQIGGTGVGYSATAITAGTSGTNFAIKTNQGNSNGYELQIFANTTNRAPTGSAVNGILNIGAGASTIFNPTSGSASFNGANINYSVAQTGTAVGISRGLYINPTVTTAYDFRGLEVSPYTFNLNVSTTTTVGTLLGQYTVASSTAATVTNAFAQRIAGAPIASTNVTLSTSTALIVDAGAVNGGGTVTKAYGLQVFAPTGATNNYAASFINGNVGVGTSTPFGLLAVDAPAGSASFAIGSSTATSFIVDKNGNVGVGTASPLKQLDVSGDVRASGTLFSVGGRLDLSPSSNSGFGMSVIGSTLLFNSNGSNDVAALYNSGQFNVRADIGTLGFVSGSNPNVSPDTALSRGGANKMYVGNGTVGDFTGTLIAGNIGIGTTTPFGSLAVNSIGNQPGFVVGSSTATSFIVDKNGNVGIGKVNPNYKLDILDSNTTDEVSRGTQVITLNDSGALTTGEYLKFAQYASMNASGSYGATGGVYEVTGAVGSGNYSGTINSVGAGSVLYVNGVNASSNFSGTANGDASDVVRVSGLYASATGNIGTLAETSHVGGYLDVAGTANNNYGLYVKTTGATNNYGVYINTPSAGATNYALYSAAAAQSYFAGNVGIGTTSPSATFAVQFPSSDGSRGVVFSDVNGFEKFKLTDQGTLSRHIGTAAYWTETQRDTSYVGLLGNGADYFLNYDLANQRVAVGPSSTKPLSRFQVDGNQTVGNGYAGIAAPTNGLIVEGNVGIATTTPGSTLSIGTTGGINFYENATSTFAKGINIKAGCFSINGSCVGGGSGTTPSIGGTLTSATAGSVLFAGSGTFAQDNSNFFFDNSTKRLGLGTTSPFAKLSVSSIAGEAAFVVGSSTATSFIVTSVGNVGVGTASPDSKLAVAGDISLPRTSNIIFGQNSDGTGEKIGNSSYGLSFYVSNSERLRIGAAKTYIVGNGSSSGLEFRNTATGWTYGGIYTEDITGWNGALVFTTDGDGVNNNNPTEKMRISPGGNIGIATTSPWGSLAVNNIAGQPGFVVGSSTATSFIVDKNGNVGIGTSTPASNLALITNSAGVAPMLIQNNSSAGFSDVLFKDSNGVSQGAVGFANSSAAIVPGTLFLGTLTSSPLAFVVNSSEKMRLTDTGNIGIGTTTPNALLSLQKVGGTADLLRISSTTGASMITVSQWGGFSQNISSTSALSIRNGSNVPVFEVDTTQTTTNAGLDITAGSSQTGNLLNFYSSGGSFLSGITAAGGILMNVSSSTAVNVLDGSNVAAFVVNSASKSVGIGTSTLTYNLNVEGSQSGTYIARINNADTSTTADGLLISLGVANASRTTSNYFIGFSDGAGTVAGKIQGGASAVAYTTTAADLAEYFSVASTTDKPTPGEVVALAGASTRTVTRASGGIPFGIVSTNPGFIGNGPICPQSVTDCDENYKKYNVLVALTGQVPVRVNAENGAIKVGDSITLSSTAGVATKALPGDPVLAIAIEAQSFATTTATTTVLAYIAKSDSLAYNYTDLDIATSTSFASGLDLVKQLESIEFTYAGSQKTYLGFVPGAVELLNPKLVKHNTDGSVLGLNHDAFLPVITSAIKALDVKVSALDQRISDLELAGGAGNGSGLDFAAIINQFENIGARFVNGIAYLKNVFVETLTVGTPEKPTGITLYDEVTGEPYCLKVSNGAMVSAVGVCTVVEEVPPTSNGNATTTDIIAPEILIMGNNPAEIQVGSSYVDLGATVTDMGINPLDPSGPLVLNNNLGIQYAVNGVSVSDITIDTSATSTHTIVFSAVDAAGNWSHATRTVEVIPVQ